LADLRRIISRPGSGLLDLARHCRVELTLSVRMTIAALVSLALAQLLQLRLPLWVVMTAVIVTQMSVGRSLKATFDYLIGTLGGALYGGAIGLFVPYSNEIGLLAALALAVAPLAFLAAMNPSLGVAPITAVIVLLVPTMTHVTPVVSAFDRVLEVALGGTVGLFISFLLLPSNAHRLIAEAAARALDQMAQALGDLLAGWMRGLDVETLHCIQDGIGQALAQLNVIGAEAEHERLARVAAGPDAAPLLRTLVRLRHDLVMIGRAAMTPLPESLRPRIESPLNHLEIALADYFRAGGAALVARREPPSLNAVETALDAYAAEIAKIRRDGLMASLPADAAEGLFALGFAVQQMFNNFKDLERCVVEWARSSEDYRRSILQQRAHQHDPTTPAARN
jgi:uncharacterized membrane protein YccC